MHRKLLLGSSIQGRTLEAVEILPQPNCEKILCLGAVHGDEVEGVWLMDHMLEQWMKQFPFNKVGVVVWPQVNPDGFALGQRWNANHIDLNRNLPSRDWTPEIKNPRYPPGPSACSESENKALVKLIEDLKPRAILSVHSFSNYQVNANGPSRDWAEVLAKVCGYPVTEDIGYPTPGSLGSYAGIERQIPTITLEIERGITKEKVLELHTPVMQAAIEYWEKRIS